MPITTTRLGASVAVLAALPLLVWCQRPPEPAPAAAAPAAGLEDERALVDEAMALFARQMREAASEGERRRCGEHPRPLRDEGEHYTLHAQD